MRVSRLWIGGVVAISVVLPTSALSAGTPYSQFWKVNLLRYSACSYDPARTPAGKEGCAEIRAEQLNAALAASKAETEKQISDTKSRIERKFSWTDQVLDMYVSGKARHDTWDGTFGAYLNCLADAIEAQPSFLEKRSYSPKVAIDACTEKEMATVAAAEDKLQQRRVKQAIAAHQRFIKQIHFDDEGVELGDSYKNDQALFPPVFSGAPM